MAKLTVFSIVVLTRCNMIFVNNKSTTLNLCAYFCDLNRCAGSLITNMADGFARTSAGFLADLSLCLRL